MHFEDDVYNFEDYCFDRILKDTKVKVTVVVCFKVDLPKEDPNILYHKFETYGKLDLKAFKGFSIIIILVYYLFNFAVVYASILLLLLTLAIYIYIKELQSLRGKVLMCYIVNLTIFYSLTTFLRFNVLNNSKACTIFGYLAYSSSISTILCLNVINIDSFITQL